VKHERAGIVYIVSDSVGETAEFVVRAASSQFDHDGFELRRISHVADVDVLQDVVERAQHDGALIAYTLILPNLREQLKDRAQAVGVRAVDIMGPMLDAFAEVFGLVPKLRPGLLHQLDDEYFRRVEAVEFAVKYDDGRDSRGLSRADVVLLGVSRTSKTPVSMYLAHRGLRVANVPLVPEVRPPDELFRVPPTRVVGLTIAPTDLNDIRSERLRVLGLATGASYATPDRIREELAFAHAVMAKIGCIVIDVSRRAVEETAGIIIEHVGRVRRES
jgi:regulator of PEP synthase PpsR (kinase-PPPase family)